MSTQLSRIEGQIAGVKEELMALGHMRPGSITMQYRQPKEKLGPFHQISYTFKMRSRTEYVRQEDVAVLSEETANFKLFKKLIDKWVELELAASKLRIKSGREKTPKRA
jgi:uncharacterized membrane protein YvbJ